MFNQRGAVAAVYRLIPETIRNFQELGLPPTESLGADPKFSLLRLKQ